LEHFLIFCQTNVSVLGLQSCTSVCLFFMDFLSFQLHLRSLLPGSLVRHLGLRSLYQRSLARHLCWESLALHSHLFSKSSSEVSCTSPLSGESCTSLPFGLCPSFDFILER